MSSLLIFETKWFDKELSEQVFVNPSLAGRSSVDSKKLEHARGMTYAGVPPLV